MAGGVAGGLQWLILRDIDPDLGRRWLLASTAGGGCGALTALLIGVAGTLLLLVSFLLSGPGVALLVAGAAFGGIFGAAQAIVLGDLIPGSPHGWWLVNLLAGGLCAALSLPMTSLWIPVLCSPGPLIFGLLTGLALRHLLREDL